jgi:D-alanyl-D-alanine dipeptidase
MRYLLNLLVVSGLQLKCGLELSMQAALGVGAGCIRHFLLNGTLLLLCACSSSISEPNAATALGFINLVDFMDRHEAALEVDVRYFGTDNFVGAKVDGYGAEKIYATEEAAAALLIVQKILNSRGLALKVFDAYRPQQAVDHFVRWAKDLGDARMKAKYYPRVDKESLFSGGYIASRSGHSRGSTIDLTIVTLVDGEELDMGTSWDFFDPLSWSLSDQVSLSQRANRDTLRELMIAAGFIPLNEEWWHFTLGEEPYPDRYFNFKVE